MKEHTNPFTVYIERLRKGHVETINESFDSSFLGVNEPALYFSGPVTVRGEIYIASSELILHLSIHVKSIVPCIVCNAPVEVEIDIPNLYEAVSLEKIPHGTFSIQDILRQAILLESKAFAECGGKCPRRTEIAPYLKRTSEPSPFDKLKKEDFEH